MSPPAAKEDQSNGTNADMSPPAAKEDQSNGTSHEFATSIPECEVTEARKPFLPKPSDERLSDSGTARANIAATFAHPQGTQKADWANRHQDKTVLQQHCLFFNPSGSGVIWPLDTYRGFYRLGFGFFLSLLSVLVIHSNFSYPTLPKGHYLPDPFFRVYVPRIHADKHGSDSGTYDNEGRFIPQKFEDIFAKYARGREFITKKETIKYLSGQRCIADPIGWGGAIFEWLATWILLWPKDGKLMKEDVRRVYDGSLFYEIAERRERDQKAPSAVLLPAGLFAEKSNRLPDKQQ